MPCQKPKDKRSIICNPVDLPVISLGNTQFPSFPLGAQTLIEQDSGGVRRSKLFASFDEINARVTKLNFDTETQLSFI